MRIIILLVLAAIALNTDATGHDEQPAVDTNASSSVSERVPVVVDGRFPCDDLTDEQYEELVSDAIANNPEGQTIWFIRLKRNSGRRFCAEVYFTPEESTPRLRKGRCILRNELTDVVRELRRSMIDYKPCQPLGQYVQVSLKDQVFTERLEAPAGTLLPFDPPEELGDQELVSLIDFLRSTDEGSRSTKGGPQLKHDPQSGRVRVLIGLPAETPNDIVPIVKVTVDGLQIEVWTGHCEGFLSGHGQSIAIQLGEKDYRIVSVGDWVS